MTKSISPKIGRRDFLAVCGLTGASASLPCLAQNLQAKAPFSDCKTFHATCSMECLHCNLKGYVNKEGELVKIESDNPFNGKACSRGLSRVKWVYAKDRILHPLKRVGKKGEGKFEPMSWDEALDLVASKMKEAIAKDGSGSILFTAASGNMDGIVNGIQGAFGNYLGGVTRTAGSLCCSAVGAAMIPITGLRYADTRDTIPQAKLVIAWGNNPMVTMQAYWPQYLKMMENGGKLIVIDPRKSETAAHANEWIPIVPGTDTALALGMIRVIAKENLLDKPFLAAHTGAPYLVDKEGKLVKVNGADGKPTYAVWDEKTKEVRPNDAEGVQPALTLSKNSPYKTALMLALAEAEPWTPAKVEKETGVPAKKVTELARAYAKGPSMIINNMGSFQRTEFGTQAVGGQFYLALLTGNIGKPGCGVCDAGGVTQMGKFGGPVPGPKQKPAKIAPINTSKLGESILADKPHKINVWYSQTCGVLGQWPNANKVREAMEKVPFVVVAENLMTPTAMYADVILPVATVFEYDSVMAGARNHYVQLIEKAVEPQGEAQPDYWIISQLAKRFGFKEFDLTPRQMIENVLKPSDITYEDLKKGPVCPVKGDWVPFADGVFRTPNGKANIYLEPWTAKGFKPVVSYYPVVESPKGSPELAKKYPLMAIQRKVIRNIHTSHQNNEWLLQIHKKAPTVWINAQDAKARGIANGDEIVVFNDRGSYKAKALVTRNIVPHTVSLENGWWMDKNGFTTSSVLTNDTMEVLGNGTAICSTLVNVKKA